MNVLSLEPFFSKLGYPSTLIEQCFSIFLDNIYKESNDDNTDKESKDGNDIETFRHSLPFKNQSSANLVKEQLRSLSSSIGIDI